MKHGPLALIDRFMPVVMIAPSSDPTYDKTKANIKEVLARKGSVIAITESETTSWMPNAKTSFTRPMSQRHAAVGDCNPAAAVVLLHR